jgi:hypothetical protein
MKRWRRNILILQYFSRSANEEQESSKKKERRESFFSKHIGSILTFLGLTVGLYQYLASQKASQLSKVQETYYMEKLDIYKNMSGSISATLVEINRYDSFAKAYNKFKENYFKILLIRDEGDSALLNNLKEYDTIIYLFLDKKITDVQKANLLPQASNLVEKINSEMNKILLNEREKIKSSNNLSDYFPTLW